MVFFIDKARSRPPPPLLLTNVNNKMVFLMKASISRSRHATGCPRLKNKNKTKSELSCGTPCINDERSHTVFPFVLVLSGTEEATSACRRA